MFKVIRSNRPEIETLQIFHLYSKKQHKTSSDRQIIVVVVESSGNAEIFNRKFGNGSYCACAEQIWPKQPRMTGATSGSLKLQCIAIVTFSSFILVL